MAFKVFFDTNTIFDLFYKERPLHKEALDLFYFLDENYFTAFYSESVLTTAAYILRKEIAPGKLNEILINLNKKIKLLPCFDFLPEKVLKDKPRDFEDALLYGIALQSKLDYFISNNLKDFKAFQQTELPVLNSREFNKILVSGM